MEERGHFVTVSFPWATQLVFHDSETYDLIDCSKDSHEWQSSTLAFNSWDGRVVRVTSNSIELYDIDSALTVETNHSFSFSDDVDVVVADISGGCIVVGWRVGSEIQIHVYLAVQKQSNVAIEEIGRPFHMNSEPSLMKLLNLTNGAGRICLIGTHDKKIFLLDLRHSGLVLIGEIDSTC